MATDLVLCKGGPLHDKAISYRGLWFTFKLRDPALFADQNFNSGKGGEGTHYRFQETRHGDRYLCEEWDR
jgi:hypothetical protein